MTLKEVKQHLAMYPDRLDDSEVVMVVTGKGKTAKLAFCIERIESSNNLINGSLFIAIEGIVQVTGRVI